MCSALPDTGTSRTIIRKSVLEAAGIGFDERGKESISAANGSSISCVGNVILDTQIDHGKKLLIDALVVSDLHSECLLAWKDLQRAGILHSNFPAMVNETRVNASADNL